MYIIESNYQKKQSKILHKHFDEIGTIFGILTYPNQFSSNNFGCNPMV